ncbi:hypothetical protein SAMN05660841_00013 [Sphingobacterium nematocida]|uniref:F5/8 type C domain-containing protein n=1 Tax=Sphingobacterium nematocida TaxID=1513896 RepID=A0A1T5ANI6_9SPHI|nr:hypothetical protein [Sphingobacterium nematocida]SKB36173.1 hypothetical protein SAMN05660841_00013 [Sphingobacterium nematocida]
MKKIIISLFVCLFTTISNGQTFDDMISVATMASGAWDQSIHGWAQDPDNEWRYHFDLNRTTDIVFDMSIGLKRSSGSDSFHEAKVYVILTHPTDQGVFWKISPDVIFTPGDFTAQGSSGNYSRNRTVQVTIPQQLFNTYFTPGNFPLNYRISVGVEGKMNSLGTFETFKNYQQEKFREYKIKPIILGAGQLCNEEVFNIYYASNVTLENATGIATLTDLGNGQWKVTKIGNGNVILKATNANKIVEKRILIGAATIVGDIISGNSAITPPNSGYSIYDYEISTDAVNQIEWVSSGWSDVIVQFNGNRASLSVPANNTSTNKTVQLKVRVLNACGNSDYVYKNITIYKSGGGSGGPDPEGPIQ